MASSEPRFEVTVDYALTSIQAPYYSQIGFLLHIRTFLEDDDGRFREDFWQNGIQEFSVHPEIVFGSRRHRNNVARPLHEAGWLDQLDLERILDQAFSDWNSIIKIEKDSKELIQALKKVKLVQGYGDGESDNVECMICIEKLVQPETEVVTSMPCSHLFHGECIERWLSTGHLYPLCRFPMPTDAEKH
ncbi:hypothetical protein HRI_000082800 [Hibiscus trionum]|uniref:RING-type E3 ubiquitin transferase n=1 Tax=Hibiscus trionum TaxID=183268 RepID=A0A9W7GTL1_HIBTR|nr:hypothetical protein HRI_000081500 [Hibiscus trionum]GMI64124.1 hypothetical protein HRI_000081700 [Hibiscus trionum]GMI64128.1 hypothetical protein HRI_000082100 [Hibiscus trionum]GMI64129.1 hypothetical protein HRI_000082200 [Hibiscus trionum]GMI64131.1 hypothetical protein HRI_000082400 [Hibiscus trionum]